MEHEKFTAAFSEILDAPKSILLVAEEQDNLIGYCLGFWHETFYANGKVAWLEEIMVSPAHRRSGVGDELMAEFEGWAKKEGAVLSALATRRASSFYKAIGYEDSATYFRKIL